MRLIDADLPKLNKAEPQPLTPLHKIPDEAGGGYLGELEVFHQLHCLVSTFQISPPLSEVLL